MMILSSAYAVLNFDTEEFRNPLNVNCIKRKINSLLQEYQYLYKVSTNKKKEKCGNRYVKFVCEQTSLVDISTVESWVLFEF